MCITQARERVFIRDIYIYIRDIGLTTLQILLLLTAVIYNISCERRGWGALKRLFSEATSLAVQNIAAILHGASRIINLRNLFRSFVANHVIISPKAGRSNSETEQLE